MRRVASPASGSTNMLEAGTLLLQGMVRCRLASRCPASWIVSIVSIVSTAWWMLAFIRWIILLYYTYYTYYTHYALLVEDRFH